MEERGLIAPCGDYCGGCAQHNGIAVDTATQMRELADLYGFECRAKEAFDFKEFVKGLEWFVENARCPGCREGGGPPWCEVRRCSGEKAVRICFDCAEFPCRGFKDYQDADNMERYRRCKELGFDRWLEEQAEKASKGYEIHLRKEVSLRLREPRKESSSP